jgi:hypothetical protein
LQEVHWLKNLAINFEMEEEVPRRLGQIGEGTVSWDLEKVQRIKTPASRCVINLEESGSEV